MSVKIGHASVDENRKARGGASGDQTKKEVCTRTWYNKPWTSVIRPKDSTAAEKIAIAMEQACANDNIGYDQGQRTTLYAQAKAKNWDISKVTTACECDCSSLVAVCVNAAGIPVSKDIYTGNELAALKATGKFDVYTSVQYVGSDAHLKRGDILLGDGHTAIVLSDGSNAGAQSSSGSSVTTETIHVVKIFETLSKIAAKYGTTYQELAKYNNIANPHLIRIGQKIKIPDTKTETVYVVKSGDTLSAIAAKYNTTYQALAKYNNISNPSLIHIGQQIRIPN
jgi:LysM repeat protein